MEYGTAAAQVVSEASAALSNLRRLVVVVIQNQSNQLHGAVGTAAGLDTTRAREKKGVEVPFKSDASTTYVGSLFNSDGIEDALHKFTVPRDFGPLSGALGCFFLLYTFSHNKYNSITDIFFLGYVETDPRNLPSIDSLDGQIWGMSSF
jgi:hypothetical protein